MIVRPVQSEVGVCATATYPQTLVGDSEPLDELIQKYFQVGSNGFELTQNMTVSQANLRILRSPRRR